MYRPDILSHAYHLVRSNKGAPGIDGVSFASIEAGEGEDHFLRKLQEELESKSYRAQAVRRVWIPKPDGSERPLGIPTIRDRVAQMAVKLIIEPIFEADFCDTSYGFRPKRSAHDAADAVAESLFRRHGQVIDADLSKYFDTIPHAKLLAVVAERISDGGILWLIKQWLKAAVVEEKNGKRRTTGGGKGNRLGTPQGAVISPLLANIYLHYALDQWVKWWRDQAARGEVYIVRYADDFVMGFQLKSDAEQFQAGLKVRLSKVGLEMHEGKTRLVEFGRFAAKNRQERGERKPDTFDFLGFTHICSTNKNGSFKIYRKTIAKRLRAKIKVVRETLRRNRHRPVAEQGAWLRAVMQGHFNYYGVPGNRKALDTFRTQIQHSWFHALRGRSQKALALTWERMKKLIRTWLPTAKVVHPYPNQRFCV
jgi:group II intron reverse transcriptase/maturase